MATQEKNRYDMMQNELQALFCVRDDFKVYW